MASMLPYGSLRPGIPPGAGHAMNSAHVQAEFRQHGFPKYMTLSPDGYITAYGPGGRIYACRLGIDRDTFINPGKWYRLEAKFPTQDQAEKVPTPPPMAVSRHEQAGRYFLLSPENVFYSFWKGKLVKHSKLGVPICTFQGWVRLEEFDDKRSAAYQETLPPMRFVNGKWHTWNYLQWKRGEGVGARR